MQTVFGAVVVSSFALTPAFAGQHGHQGAPPAHANAPSSGPKSPASTPKTTTTTTTAPATRSPIATKIAANPQLTTRLQALLPKGMTLATASAGFKNQGQFIAALHVSHNLNIPFAQLKAEMTGTDHDSLGRAIQDLRPSTSNVKTATKTAETEADEDVKVTKPVKPVKPHTDRDDR
jgi:hypothetical protein